MANVNMDLVRIGQQYTAVQLANIWNYKSHHPLVKGIVTPSGTDIIILFVTKEKQSGATQYVDEIKENILYMMGQEKHGSDARLIRNLNENKDKIYLFFRDLHHTPFTYYGRCFLINAKEKTNEPSDFEFLLEYCEGEIGNEMDLVDYFVNIPIESGESIPLLIEGTKKITQHVRYERNPHNRKEAIRLQGHKCKICGFDFDEVYGKELADSYIEVHHIKQLANGEQEVNPAKDLLPVCANCHRMLHRKKNGNTTIDDLRNKICVSYYRDNLKKIYDKSNQ